MTILPSSAGTWNSNVPRNGPMSIAVLNEQVNVNLWIRKLPWRNQEYLIFYYCQGENIRMILTLFELGKIFVN